MGCGRLNTHGYHIQSIWDDQGERSLCTFHPAPWHTALPGYVYGGLLASVIDCHATGTAAEIAHRADRKRAYPRFVTASLTVDFLKPTPLAPFEVEGRLEAQEGRRVIIACTITSGGERTVRGRVTVAEITQKGWPLRSPAGSAASGTP
ncbi:thioesterase superfamily protein [mine drainage metagenome]|uniref:Acyl-coenzyme A thioesterase THEM4 n=1 Tax=mine drainage metagenome TaxID=410659 RepID=T0ZTB9_9ZZZZ